MGSVYMILDQLGMSVGQGGFFKDFSGVLDEGFYVILVCEYILIFRVVFNVYILFWKNQDYIWVMES